MKVWMIWVQSSDGYTWVEAAWSDDSTAENPEGWEKEVERVEAMCAGDKTLEFRIIAVNVTGVLRAFQPYEAEGEVIS